MDELDKIKTKDKWTVVDMGCGEAGISKYFMGDDRFRFINYDHVACDDTVKSVDISKLPLENDSVQICILSLAMWGSNCKKYIEEAYRVLESRGVLYISEPTKRWTDVEYSDKLKKLILDNKFSIVKEKIDKFTMLICYKM